MSPGVPSWKETEEKLISQQCVYPEKKDLWFLE